MVERYVPGLSPEWLLAATARARSVSSAMTAEGTPVRYLGSTFIPEEDACFCQFEGASKKAVEEANQRAEFPFARILAAVRISAEEART